MPKQKKHVPRKAGAPPPKAGPKSKPGYGPEYGKERKKGK